MIRNYGSNQISKDMLLYSNKGEFSDSNGKYYFNMAVAISYFDSYEDKETGHWIVLGERRKNIRFLLSHLFPFPCSKPCINKA